MTRANVIQVGLTMVFLGLTGNYFFRLIGIGEVSAGVASQSLLVVILLGWTGSYLLRVFTGKMTFVEQRKRYLEAYEKLTSAELQSRFESMSEDEQMRLLKDLEKE